MVIAIKNCNVLRREIYWWNTHRLLNIWVLVVSTNSTLSCDLFQYNKCTLHIKTYLGLLLLQIFINFCGTNCTKNCLISPLLSWLSAWSRLVSFWSKYLPIYIPVVAIKYLIYLSVIYVIHLISNSISYVQKTSIIPLS